jgi:hypothetical protein
MSNVGLHETSFIPLHRRSSPSPTTSRIILCGETLEVPRRSPTERPLISSSRQPPPWVVASTPTWQRWSVKEGRPRWPSHRGGMSSGQHRWNAEDVTGMVAIAAPQARRGGRSRLVHFFKAAMRWLGLWKIWDAKLHSVGANNGARGLRCLVEGVIVANLLPPHTCFGGKPYI